MSIISPFPSFFRVLPTIGIDAKLLCHFDGLDNGTVFVDECGHIAYPHGSPVTKIGIKKFGSASFYSPDSVNYLTFGNHPNFNLSVYDFTMGCWFYLLSDGRYHSFFSRRPSAVPYGWVLSVDPSNVLRFSCNIGGSWLDPLIVGVTPVTKNALHYVEFARRGANFYLLLDGNFESTVVNAGGVQDTANELTIGSGSDGGEGSIYGYIDEAILVVSTALHVASFPVPTTPYSLVKYVVQYPPEATDTYVKATTSYTGGYQSYLSTDPTKSLTGDHAGNAWLSVDGQNVNQRFHIDLGGAKVATRIYYENSHHYGGYTTAGVKNFTLWGSNDVGAFAELTYGVDTNWTQIPTAVSVFDEHVTADITNPKYIDITNTTAYRYYAFKFADNWGYGPAMAVRRLALVTKDTNQYQSQYPPEQTADYVKATYSHFPNPANATDPSKSLVGSEIGNCWSAYPNNANMRFHIDLGMAKIIKRIYYENMHVSGGIPEGMKHFTFWGSNDSGAFNELTYGTDTNWVQLPTNTFAFEQHATVDASDPKYIFVTNTTAYRYYAIKIPDCYPNYISCRRIELQS